MTRTEDSGPSVTAVAVEETAAAIDLSDELIGATLGKYRLVRHLATGGMAEIYLAEQAGPEGFAKEIVIKRILPHLAKDQQFTEMFLDEARLAAALNHPNIGQIVELGQHGKNYFIAMEFIDGASLDELLSTGEPLPVDVAARIIADTLRALEFAHESKDRSGTPLNIVHRDVTPSNVMVSVDGIVKLVDFGVAKATEKSHQTQTGAVKGKFAYMAPEQIETVGVDRRADIFAIGIVFYELLTGQRPFGEELAAVSRILHEEAADPRTLRPDCPESFVRIVNRALRKAPGERYPTAHTMLLDIETALRMRNSYVGPREISYVVRKFRGLPLPEGVDLSVHDTGVFASDRSGEFVGELGHQFEEAAKKEGARGSALATQVKPRLKMPAIPRLPPVSRKMVAGAAVALCVGAVAAASMALVSARDTPSSLVSGEPKTVVLNTTPFIEEGADPAALAQADGKLVLIDSIPTTRVYSGSTFVGSTPLQTTLKPGKHRIELELGDERKVATVEVDKVDGLQRRTLMYAQLGETEAEPESRRKRKRSSAGSRIKSKLRSLF